VKVEEAVAVPEAVLEVVLLDVFVAVAVAVPLAVRVRVLVGEALGVEEAVLLVEVDLEEVWEAEKERGGVTLAVPVAVALEDAVPVPERVCVRVAFGEGLLDGVAVCVLDPRDDAVDRDVREGEGVREGGGEGVREALGVRVPPPPPTPLEELGERVALGE